MSNERQVSSPVSDEEIQTEATVRAVAAACSSDEGIDGDMEFGFITGAKWMRSQSPDVAKLSEKLKEYEEREASIADMITQVLQAKGEIHNLQIDLTTLKQERDELPMPRIIGGKEMENILALKSENERFTEERKGYYDVCQKYREKIAGLEAERDEAVKVAELLRQSANRLIIR